MVNKERRMFNYEALKLIKPAPEEQKSLTIDLLKRGMVKITAYHTDQGVTLLNRPLSALLAGAAKWYALAGLIENGLDEPTKLMTSSETCPSCALYFKTIPSLLRSDCGGCPLGSSVGGGCCEEYRAFKQDPTYQNARAVGDRLMFEAMKLVVGAG